MCVWVALASLLRGHTTCMSWLCVRALPHAAVVPVHWYSSSYRSVATVTAPHGIETELEQQNAMLNN